MRVLLTSHGSTGDIYPLIGLGRALREAGHEVRYATAPLYQRDIEAAGLEFLCMPPDWGPELFAEFMRELNRCRHPLLQLIHIYCGALPFMGEVIRRMEVALRSAICWWARIFSPTSRRWRTAPACPSPPSRFATTSRPPMPIHPRSYRG